ncbi:MAG: TlpA disulfide reductase family protein, partial [Planctomycetota bacterium]
MRTAWIGTLTGIAFLGACGEQNEPPQNAGTSNGEQPAPATAAEDPTPGVLTVGDAAPPLSASRWFIGDERDAVTPGRVTLVEFWATWCGPCIAAMPHISDLAETLGDKGLDVVAVSLDRGENAAQVVADFL